MNNVKLKRRREQDSRSISVIHKIRYKAKTRRRCQRQLQLSALDPIGTRKLMVAHERLTAEINQICWSIGL